ncbi:MAG: RrF2 family transcriptional regulator [Marmoricola sp.]
MRMSVGVEWALHSCLELHWAEGPVPTGRLAALRELGSAYLNKQLQALVRAGLVTSTSGPRGGFALARPASAVSVLEVVQAIEGPVGAFRCTEIRQRGPLGAPAAACDRPCQIAAVMRRAEAAWRRELAAVTLDDLAADVERDNGPVGERVRAWLGG